MKRIWRWLWRGTLAVLALAIVAIGVLLIVLHTAWGREQIRIRAEAALAEVFPGGGAHIERIEGSVLGTLVAKGVELRDHEGRVVVQATTIQLDLALLPLLARTARVDSLVVDGVVANIHRTATQAPPRPVEPVTWSAELPHIVATNVRVEVETGAEPVTIDGLTVTAAAVAPVDQPILATAWVSGTWRERGVPVRARAALRVGDTIGLPFVLADVGGVTVSAFGVDVEHPEGHLFGLGTPDQLAKLVPGLSLPATTVVTLDATTEGDVTQVIVRGRVGAGRLDGAIEGTLESLTAHGVLAATNVELAVFTKGRVRGHGAAVVAFAGEERTRRARGAVIATGAIEGAPRGAVIVGFDATEHRADAFVIGSADGATRVAAVGAVTREGDRFELVRGSVGASTENPELASAGRAPVRGQVSLTAAARGPLDALDLDGTFTARRLRYDDLGAGRVDGTFRARLMDAPSGSAHAVATGLTRQGELLGRATAFARTLPGERFAVSTRAHPAAAPVVIDADAVITPGDVIDIALGRHRVQTASSTWTGRGGSVRVDDRRITVKNVTTTSGQGRVALDATIGRTSPTLTARLDVRDVPASALDPAYRGTIQGAVAIEQRGARWGGGGTLTGTGLVFEPGARPIDGEASLMLEGRRVMLSGKATSPEVGGARFALELDGPRELTDVEAWKKVARDDLHAIVLGFDALQPRFVTQDRIPGVYDGTLEIREGKPRGVIHVRDIATEVGPAAADVTLALTERGFVDVNATATTGTVGQAKLAARVQIPDRPFDPTAWRRLGRHVVASATARSSEIEIDPMLLSRFGVDLPYRARARVDLVVGSGAETVDVGVEVRDLRGGELARGIDVAVSAHSDAAGTEASVRAHTGPTTLLESRELRTPVTLAQWIEDPRGALSAQLRGRLDIPQQPVAELLAIVDRRDVKRGQLAGAITLGGTLRRPTGATRIELTGVDVTPKLTRRPPPTLEYLRVAADWNGTTGTLGIEGKEAGEGTLSITASGRPDDLGSIAGTVTIDDFEVAPIAVFLPGALAGASGLVDANLGIRGLDPTHASVRGTLAVAGGRMPLAPMIGTLRDANAQIEVTDDGITARLDGKIGAGKVAARANTGADGKTTTVTAKLTDVSPIGVMQPKITADVRASLRRDGLRLTGDATISNTVVRVPEEEGAALLPAQAPEDLFFVDLPLPTLKAGAQPPEKPWLVVDVTLAPARIEAPRYAVVSSLYATAEGRVKVSVGKTIGMDGRIDIERGNADLFGHRYRVEEGNVVFDGTPDARFDVTMETLLRDVTMRVRLAGRISEIDALQPQLTAEPSQYSQGQLLGFFLGGTPGGDPNDQTREAVVSAGSSLASQRVARWIERGLGPAAPLKLDVVNCVPRLSDNAVVCTFGKWATRNVFVWYDYQSERRHGDNTGSGKLEWHFKPRWTLETAFDFDFAGADLTWRKRW